MNMKMLLAGTALALAMSTGAFAQGVGCAAPQLAAGEGGSSRLAAGEGGASRLAAGEGGASRLAAGEGGASRLAAGEGGASRLAAGEGGASRLAAGEGGASRLAAGEGGASRLAAGEGGASRLAAGEGGASRLAAGEGGASRLAAGEGGASRLAAGEGGASRLAAGEGGASRLAAGEGGASRLAAGEGGASRLAAGEGGASRLAAGEGGSLRVSRPARVAPRAWRLARAELRGLPALPRPASKRLIPSGADRAAAPKGAAASACTPIRRRALAILSILALTYVAPAEARDIGDLPDLISTLLPSVVSIATVKVMIAPRTGGGPGEGGATHRVRSLGSGFMIDPGGVIVTNRHVIEGASDITVVLQSGQSFHATLMTAAGIADVALLRIAANVALPVLTFGDSDKVRVGDQVLAIGNPLGLGGSVTRGIVSALNRDIRETPFDDFIQTDAAINHGNSGGPLFNESGEVIGMNTAIYGAPEDINSGSIGLAFAMPSNDVRFVVKRLLQYGRVRAGSIGVRLQRLTPTLADALQLHRLDGGLVAGVDPGGPGEQAGIQDGDVIQQFDGHGAADIRALTRAIGVVPPGQVVPVLVWRDGRQVTMKVTVGEEPEPLPQADATLPAASLVAQRSFDLGLTLAPVDPALRDRFQLPSDQGGLVITDIAADGAAADLGLTVGDVIVKVQRVAVASEADLLRQLDAARAEKRQHALLLIRSETGTHWEALPLTP